MQKKMILTEKYLRIPVSVKQPHKRLEIFEEDKKLLEFMIPVKECRGNDELEFDSYSQISVPNLLGKELLFQGDFPEEFMSSISCGSCPKENKEMRPAFHLTAEIGWINDPNGLIYEDGTYHFYFQHNPFDTEWENMSWGHAVSRDLLHWSVKDTVLYPEKDGMIFSGSAVLNERGMLGLPKDAMLYFYTVAGGIAAWSRDRTSVQKMAYSIDHGATVVRCKEGQIGTIKKENRDPKVFFHEDSQAYVMIFWLENHEFILLRSVDLKEWKESQRFSLDEGYECPDLVCLSGDGIKCWVILTAAGYYYPGDFDGYTFTWHGYRKQLYAGSMQYAAQTYSGIHDRTVFIPWLKMEHPGKKYRGAGGLPRELSLVKEADGTVSILQKPVREYEEQKKETAEGRQFSEIGMYLEKNAAVSLRLFFEETAEEDLFIRFQEEQGKLDVGKETVLLPKGIGTGKFRLIFDDTILEIILSDGRCMGAFELPARCSGYELKEEMGVRKIEVYTL